VSALCGAPPYLAEKTAAAITLKRADGGLMLRYVIGRLPPSEPQTSAPVVGYLHPVFTPSGQVITESQGGDHAWLRGVFIAWPQVGGNRPAGFWTCGQAVWKEKGAIVNRSADAGADLNRATLAATNAWTDGSTDVLIEKTRITARALTGVHVIDLDIELSAANGPAILLPWAFAGLTFHGRRTPGESATIHSPDGEVRLKDSGWNVPQTNWPDAQWYGLILADKRGAKCGLAMMAHRDKGPTTWSINRGLRFLSANPSATTPITITRDQPLKLRYRLVTHDGVPPADVLNTLAAER
jgi:hypothetical protein